jgi:hypothetical protein
MPVNGRAQSDHPVAKVSVSSLQVPHLHRRPHTLTRRQTTNSKHPPPRPRQRQPHIQKMSVTTTANARVLTTASYLADYDLHHSQPSESDSSPAPAPNSQHQHPESPTSTSSVTPGNPEGWEDRWNRVPAYRPVQNQLDEMRTTYTSGIERNFVRVMFGGEFLLSSFYSHPPIFLCCRSFARLLDFSGIETDCASCQPGDVVFEWWRCL